jgi:arabinoxylan arabinofuranohydrolase
LSKRTLVVLLGLLAAASAGRAQNPIVPPGVYIADPTARQWKDGRVYVYGSRDEDPGYYCSWKYHVLSSLDLKSWTLHENRFATKGPGDEVPYSDDILYAPDCQYRNGKYYLYYCLASSKNTEGVAVSGSPAGPFEGGRVIDLGGRNEIDPAVFVDDDGQAYYIWGQFSAKMAKLKPSMTEVDLSTVKDGVVTEKEHFFHEGGFLVKRNGLYYFVYAHMGRAGRPTSIGYATSRSPMGPYRHGGVIVDNDHSDPAVWNNHGSLAEVNGRWYVFYHRSTHGSNTMRKACVEPITFAADGSIPEVEMTTQGASGPLRARAKMDAERACLLYGNVRVQKIAPDNEQLGGIRSGDAAAYKYLDFGERVSTFTARVAPGAKPARIDLALDSSWGPSIGTIEGPGGGDGRTWTTVSGKVKSPEGVHALWLRFSGEGEDVLRLDWFAFE